MSSCAATTGITQLESSEDSRSSKGAVYAGVGVVIGAIAIAGAVVLIFFVLRRKKSPQSIPNIELRGTNYRYEIIEFHLRTKGFYYKFYKFDESDKERISTSSRN